jgi:hypothetical protein
VGKRLRLAKPAQVDVVARRRLLLDALWSRRFLGSGHPRYEDDRSEESTQVFGEWRHQLGQPAILHSVVERALKLRNDGPRFSSDNG